MNTVSLVNVDKYDCALIYRALMLSLENLNFPVPSDQSILLKPNILAMNRPQQHSITHFLLIEALIRLLQENGNRITIGESIAFYQKGLTERAFRTSKIAALAEKYSIELLPFEKAVLVKITENIESPIPLYIPKALLEADMVIGLPKLKTHSSLRMTGAVKNMYGSMPGGYKQLGHMRTVNDLQLSDIFIDICETVRPALFIMDAIVGLDGGPSAAGKPRFTGRIISSTNPYALDTVAAKILGYEPQEIPTLVRARERGLISDFSSIDIKGTMPHVKYKKLIKGPISHHKNRDSMFVTDTYVTPFIDRTKCSSCMECAEFCPAGAVYMNPETGGVPVIDYSKCIYCYHCLYSCPEHAFRVRPSLKNRIINFMRFLLRI